MGRYLTEDDKALLAELGITPESKKPPAGSPREERIIVGFAEIQHFVDKHKRTPQQGEGRDIGERVYAIRLDRIRKSSEARDLLLPYDRHGLLLAEGKDYEDENCTISDADLLMQLGISVDRNSIKNLRHVRSSSERNFADIIASRRKCEDFEEFKRLFDAVQEDLDKGVRETRAFEIKSEIEKGRFFIVGGLKAYVADKGVPFRTDHGVIDARLRVIFDNGTESNLLMRSLHRALNKDNAGRRITDRTSGPLFSSSVEEKDQESGLIYVLRSESNLPEIKQNRNLIHKIGVTNEDLDRRLAGANLQTTFLMANIKVVATYRLYNIQRRSFEKLIHSIFSNAKLEISIEDRFGRFVSPKEWFLVPLHEIELAIDRIMDGTITSYVYDIKSARLVKRRDTL